MRVRKIPYLYNVYIKYFKGYSLKHLEDGDKDEKDHIESNDDFFKTFNR